jgi:hypothetical protein
MTVLTMPAQPGQDAGQKPRPVPWRRMLWVTWRQHRATFISVPAVLAAAAILLVIFGLKAHHEYTALLNCPLDPGKQSGACSQLMTNFNSGVWPLANICSILMQLVPVLLGAFLGMLFRRIIPAMAATLGVYLAIRLAAWGVRGQYPLTLVTSNAKQFTAYGTPSQPGFPWILNSWITGPGGKPASQSIVAQVQDNLGGGGNQVVSVPKGYTIWTRFFPPSHFWPMQLIEAGWLLILALALGAATVWLVRRRAA